MRAAFVFLLVIVCNCWNPSPAGAQGATWGYEFTAGVWPVTPSGNVLSHGTTTDFRSDLGIGSKVHPIFKAVIKPAAKHGFSVEFVPYRFEGENTLAKSFRFAGQTYPAQDTIHSKANLNYLYGGYQYDILRRERGFLAVVAGIAYFDASVRAESRVFGSSDEERKLPLPIAGVRFRVFPFEGDFFNINGEIKGMSYGGYGRYIH